MADIRMMRNQIKEIEKEIEEERTKDIDRIIEKLFRYHIASGDPHFKFLQEIENDLRAYQFKYRQ